MLIVRHPCAVVSLIRPRLDFSSPTSLYTSAFASLVGHSQLLAALTYFVVPHFFLAHLYDLAIRKNGVEEYRWTLSMSLGAGDGIWIAMML